MEVERLGSLGPSEIGSEETGDQVLTQNVFLFSRRLSDLPLMCSAQLKADA